MTGVLAVSHKPDFSRFLDGGGDRLHVAAHSHHPWPDVSFDAHVRAWSDAARLHDAKWDHVLGEVLPSAATHIAARLRLPDPASLVFAPNTHEFVARVLSCFEAPIRVLSTDAEFHSLRRQLDRLAEDGLVELERVAARPFDTFTDRLVEAAGRSRHDLLVFSSVQFDSGHVVADLEAIVAAADDETMVVIDGYHQFMAMPLDLSRLADRVFFLAGGYKYAMAGEGACFLHVPEGWGMRPRFTGWYAEFGDLEQQPGQQVAYTRDANRFAGATFDPTGLYRLGAVQDWLVSIGVGPAEVHGHVAALQEAFLDRLMDLDGLAFGIQHLVPGLEAPDRGNFLTFAFPAAGEVRAALADVGVMVDHRGDRLRFGFGIYHDLDDIDLLVERLARSGAAG